MQGNYGIGTADHARIEHKAIQGESFRIHNDEMKERKGKKNKMQ